MFESLGLLCRVFSQGGCDSRAEPLYYSMEGVIPMKEHACAGGCCKLDIHCYTVLYQPKLLE